MGGYKLPFVNVFENRIFFYIPNPDIRNRFKSFVFIIFSNERAKYLIDQRSRV